MLRPGDIIIKKNAEMGGGSPKEGMLVVIHVVDTEAIALPVEAVGSGKTPLEGKVMILQEDAGRNIPYEGFVHAEGVSRISTQNYQKISTIDETKLDEVLRLYVKHAASWHFGRFNKKADIIQAAGKVLDESDLFSLIDASLDLWLTAGRFAQKFERDFPNYLGAKYCSLVNSGSSANLLAISALTSYKLGERKLKPGDEVITVAAAFPTTITPIIQNGLVPVFVDVEMGSYNIEVKQVEGAISGKTRAIFIAHTLGNPFDLGKVLAICKKYDLWLIEDNCDALGSKYDSKYTGTFGDLSTFSFYPAHHMTMGEGGAVVTNEITLSRLIASFRDWGRDCWCPPGKDNTCGKRYGWKFGELPAGYDHKYVYSHLGYNLKATDLQAALGLSQMEKLDYFIARRRENFEYLYDNFLKRGLDKYFILPKWLEKAEVSWFGFPLTIKNGAMFQRDQLLEFLGGGGIGTRLLFAGDMTKQPAFVENQVSYRTYGKLTNTAMISRNTFWVGVWPGIIEKDLDQMVDLFCKFVER